jgi:hypothetical protein
MATSRNVTRWSITIIACLIGLPHAAAAQQAAASQSGGGPMTIERVENGFVLAPDFKYTEIDKSAARLAGASGGWVYDNTLLLGAAGYWQTNQSNGPRMSYGGAVVKWLVQNTEPVGFSLGALVGGGEARLPTTVTFASFDHDGRGPDNRPNVVTTQTGTVLVRERFMVFEPEAGVSLRLGRQVRLAAGVGYRVVGGAFHDANSRLQGATGTVSLQFFTSPGRASTKTRRP